MNAQKALMRAKQETHEIAQFPLSNPHPLIQISTDGDIIFMNFAAQQTFPDIQTRGLAHPVLSNIPEIVGAQQIFTRETTFHSHVYHQTITPAHARNQNTYIVYCYDITDRKDYEAQLKAARKDAENARIAAEKANQSRGNFLANMSHELRTPMNGIIGLSDILVESGLKGEHHSLIEAINTSAHSLLILLNDLLDFAKIEAGELTVENIPCDLRKIVQQIHDLQNPVASAKGLILETDIAEVVPPRLMVDPARLQQILNNLISNALKFTDDGRITITVGGVQKTPDTFMTHISVSDTGIGIPEDKQADIFAKFQQADGSTARKYGGTGLGLAITRELTELMSGTIALKSKPGEGAVFTLKIPTQIAANESKKKPEQTGDMLQNNIALDRNVRILVVDDHPVNLLFMRTTLKKLGFQNFDEAGSGKEALDFFAQHKYDLILMDCQMPDMDGFEAAKVIRQTETLKTGPVIIAVTADAMKGAEEKCRAAGMDDYINKPVDKEKLVSLLRKWIPGHDPPSGICAANIEQSKNHTVFDWDQLHDFTDGDKDAENQIIDLFIENLKVDFDNLSRAYEAQQYHEWDSAVHKLYGACAHIGAHALATICDEAQSLPGPEKETIKALHEAILSEYQRVQDVLEKTPRRLSYKLLPAD